MKTWKKVAIGVGAVLVVGIIVGITVYQSHKNLVTVQTGKAQKQSLSSVVSASGEIKPKTYVNIGANAFGKIIRLHVKEGDRVQKGQVLAQLENVQSSADVDANKASLQMAETDFIAAQAGLLTSRADSNRAQSDADHAGLDWERAQGLYKGALIAKQDYDTKKAAFDSAEAGLAQAKARVEQAKAQMDSAQRHISQNQANLTRVSDVLQKTIYAAPYDGVVTNLPVREGETVVMGIQNAPGSTLMTIADMSVITAEVKVDETDIVNVKMGQPAEVTIDAIPRKVFHGTVTEIGDNAMVRSTGVATSQATSTIPGGKGLQGGGDAHRSAGEFAAGTFGDGQDHDGDAERRADDSDPGADGAQTRRPGAEDAERTRDRCRRRGARGDYGGEGRSAGRVRDSRRASRSLCRCDTGIIGTTDIEVLDGIERGRRNRDRELQGVCAL